MKSTPLCAGVAKLDITPPIGIDMGGFGARVQPAIDMRDPIFAKALLLDNGQSRIAIISCDLLGFSDAYDQKLRKAIAATGIVEAESAMIACTHSHAGPATQFLRNCGNVDEMWLAQLQRQIVNVVKQAGKALRPVSAEYSWGRARLNYDRRTYPMNVVAHDNFARGERDTRVSIVQFKSNGKSLVNLLHYACHPVAMLGENRSYSAEYCGAACDYLEEKTGAPTLFLNGACGNVNPLLEDAAGKLQRVTNFPEREYSHALQLGRKIGEVAFRVTKRSRLLEKTNLSASLQRIEVPLQVASPEEIETALEVHQSGLQSETLSDSQRWVHTTFSDWAQQAKAETEAGRAPRSTQVALQRISIGELKLIGVSGELFAAIGKQIEKIVGKPCLVVGFANGNIGYLPTRKSFRQGGYEVEDAGRLYGLFGVGPQAERAILSGVQSIV